jgi:hypothetical protein
MGSRVGRLAVFLVIVLVIVVTAGCGGQTLAVTPSSTGAVTTLDTVSVTSAPTTASSTAASPALVVTHNGAPLKTFSMEDLQALPRFDGWAGYRMEKPVDPILGPDAVTGVKITDIVASALGAQLKDGQSVEVIASDKYSWPWTFDQLVNFTGFVMWDALTGQKIADTTGLKKSFAAILVYNDPDARVMKPVDGPLRFFVADSLDRNVVMTASESVRWVVQLDIKDA